MSIYDIRNQLHNLENVDTTINIAALIESGKPVRLCGWVFWKAATLTGTYYFASKEGEPSGKARKFTKLAYIRIFAKHSRNL